MIRKFMCRLGFHSWYLDSGMFSRVNRCNYCLAVDSKEHAEQVDYERKLWAEENTDNNFLATADKVAKRLFNS